LEKFRPWLGQPNPNIFPIKSRDQTGPSAAGWGPALREFCWDSKTGVLKEILLNINFN